MNAPLGKTILTQHTIRKNKCFYWSDSRTVLLWIKSDPRLYQTFVSHRLGEIADLTDPSDWRWVPSELNPADDATKNKSIPLHTNTRWFSGPPFLKSRQSDWPEQTCVESIEKTNLDQLEQKKVYVAVVEQISEPCMPHFERFSKWIRLLRSTAMLLVAVDRFKRKNVYRPEVEHFRQAENLLILRVQLDSFGKELGALKGGKTIDSSSRLKSLTPSVHEDGLLHVQGRVTAGIDSSFNSHPPILDGKHPITRLIVHHFHKKLNHGSPNTVANEIRQKYWVVNLGNTMKSVKAKCQYCKITRGKPSIPRMAELPSARLEYQQRPFSHCGLDYFGPLVVKVGRRRETRWVALFTCLTTRAIHLEIVHTASSDSAIMAIRRMIARRGQPTTLYSDNGRNFVGANNELRALQKELDLDKQRYCMTNLGIKWLFIPPDAPHMGGAWERLIRSVKNALKVTLKAQEPKEEVFLTLLAEAEHSVNSRPLTHVSVDPRDQMALTLNHFLHGNSSGRVFSRFDALTSCTRKQWRIAQIFAHAFWKRWLREYLPMLLPRSKWTAENEPLKAGDVVLVMDYDTPRKTWKKALVERTIPGADNRVRVVEVQIKNKMLLRPSCKLIKIA